MPMYSDRLIFTRKKNVLTLIDVYLLTVINHEFVFFFLIFFC